MVRNYQRLKTGLAVTKSNP